MRTTARPLGFTLIETMIAMAILAIGLVGALAALLAASQSMRDGQLRQYKMTLLDATVERFQLQDKSKLVQSTLFTSAVTQPIPGTPPGPETFPRGTAPWTLDSCPATWPTGAACPAPANGSPNNDPSWGAFFIVLPNGSICAFGALCWTGPNLAAVTNCGQLDTMPEATGVYCREMFVNQGIYSPPAQQWPLGGFSGAMAGHSAYTLWIRVSRAGSFMNEASIDRQVIVQ